MRAGGMPLADGIRAVTLFSIGGVIGALLQGRMMNLLGAHRMLAVQFLVYTSLMLLLANVAPQAELIFAVAAVLGFAVHGAQAGLNAVAAETYPITVRSTGVGWALAVGRIGSIAAPLLGGAMLARNWTLQEIFHASSLPAILSAAAGIVPVAHGGQSWQEFTTFESVVLGVGGAEFYRRAFVNLEPGALRSDTMSRSLQTFRRIKDYTDARAPGRDWNVATAMVIRGEAGMQFMGDWAKGEFLAATIMRPEFQESFNLNKGSIPVGAGVRMDRFDLCAQESSAYFAATAMINTLVPSIAHLMAQPAGIEGAMREAVAAYWNNERMTTDETMNRLVAAAKARPAKGAKP